MIKCIAIDDEPLALTQLVGYINKVPFLELIKSCSSAFEAMEVLANNDIDLIYVDINMPDLNGLDFVRSLIHKPLTVFTTAYSEYAIEGFKVDALDYLLKPFGYNDFLKSANKVKQQYELLTLSNNQLNDEKHLFVKTEYRVVRLEIDSIIYIESMSEYVRIHTTQDKPIMSLLSMKVVEERLPASKFMRVHRSYIVNLQKIMEVTKGRLVMEGQVYIPISEQYKDLFNRYMGDNFLGK
jgi:two-component system LytT family response regulator